MKFFTSSLLLATALVFSGRALAAMANVGQPAPAFTVTDIAGNTHKLADYKGKTVVLEWVNPECPFVVKHYDKSGNIPALQKSATTEGVVWISINSAAAGKQGDFDATEVESWMKRVKAAPTSYVRDSQGELGRLYGAKTTPHLFVIGPDGVLVYDGAIDSIRSAKPDDIAKADNYVKAALTAVKSGQAVPKSTSTPYGCPVKY